MNRRELLAQTAAMLPARPVNRRPDGGTEGNRAPGFKVSNSADGQTAELWIYSEIGGWFGVYAEDVIDELRAIQAPNILVRMSSPGGDVFDGIAIGNALAQHPARVTVQVDSLAASIASVIAVTAGDEVVMASNAQMMIHNASGMCGGGAAEFRAFADLLDKIGGVIAQCYADRAGGDVESWAEAMAAETWYTAQEAVDAGLADRVLAAKGRKKPDEDTHDEADDGLMAALYAKDSGWRYASRAEAPAPKIAAKAVPTPRDVFAPHGAPCATCAAAEAAEDEAPAPAAEEPQEPVSEATEATQTVEDQAPDESGVAVSQEVSDNLPADPQTSTTSTTDSTDPLARLRASLTQTDPLARLREATK